MEKVYKSQLKYTMKQYRYISFLIKSCKSKKIAYDEKNITNLNRGQAGSYIAYLLTIIKKHDEIDLENERKLNELKQQEKAYKEKVAYIKRSDREFKKMMKQLHGGAL